MVFDPSDPVVDESAFKRKDWMSSEFGHVEGKEELPQCTASHRAGVYVDAPSRFLFQAKTHPEKRNPSRTISLSDPRLPPNIRLTHYISIST